VVGAQESVELAPECGGALVGPAALELLLNRERPAQLLDRRAQLHEGVIGKRVLARDDLVGIERPGQVRDGARVPVDRQVAGPRWIAAE